MKKKPSDPFRKLTWEDLDAWAGSTIVSRGRTYQRGGSVCDLARTDSGGLLAWVDGSRRYATRVDIDGKELTSVCNCPYWTTCKHAVAVVCEYLECLKQDTTIPTITDTDKRPTVLETMDGQDEDDEDWDDDEDEEEDWEEREKQYDEYDEDEDEEDDEEEREDSTRPAQKRSGTSAANSLSSFLAQQSKSNGEQGISR